MTITRANTDLHFLGIDSIKFLTLFLGIVRHSCCNIWQSWSRAWGGGCRWRTRLSRCSMGLKSGDLEGHGSSLMLFWSRYSIVTCAVCGLASSCWNNSLCRSITCMMWAWRIRLYTLLPLNFPGHVYFAPTSWHYLHRSNPLPEHRRKRNVHSGAYLRVFCHIMFLQQKKRLVAEPNSSPVSECPAP